jgi:hypothetical protein
MCGSKNVKFNPFPQIIVLLTLLYRYVLFGTSEVLYIGNKEMGAAKIVCCNMGTVVGLAAIGIAFIYLDCTAQ